MPKLVVIDHVVSAGGVERFLHGLVGGFLKHPLINDWEITILLSATNSAGRAVKWPENLIVPNLKLAHLPDFAPNKMMDRAIASLFPVSIPGVTQLRRSVRHFLLNRGPRAFLGHSDALRAWIEDFCVREKSDIVYFSWPFLLECPRLPMPTVATPHDLNFKRFDTFDPGTRDRLHRETTEWARKCNRLVVSSEFMASELRHFYPEAGDKLRVVRPGIPTSSRTPSQSELESFRRAHGLPETFLLSAGWIIPHKNQRVLIEAAGRLKAKGMNIPLVFVGPNSDQLQPSNRCQANGYVTEILQLSESLGLHYGTDFLGLGYVDDFELECLYGSAAALIATSLYEAGSFPILEASMAGLPVVCSRIAPHMEQDDLLGRNLWLFDPVEAGDLAQTVEHIMNNRKEARQRSRRAGQMLSRAYSWEKASSRYLSVFQELLSNATTDSNSLT